MPRPSFRFSIRMVFVAMTLCCIAIAWHVSYTRKEERELLKRDIDAVSKFVIANLHRGESLLGGKNEITSKREDSAMYGKWNYSIILPTEKFKDGIAADTFDQKVVAIFEAPESTDEPVSRLSNGNLQYFVPIRARKDCLGGCHHHYYGPAGSFGGRLQPRDLMAVLRFERANER